MAEHHIECIDCGGPYTAARSDAKRCPACRLLRILTFTASRCGPRICRACNEQYRPARIKDRTCGTCTPHPARKPPPIITCVICGRDGPRFQRVNVCPSCATGPASQPVVIRALEKGQAARRKQYMNTAAPK